MIQWVFGAIIILIVNAVREGFGWLVDTFRGDRCNR